VWSKVIFQRDNFIEIQHTVIIFNFVIMQASLCLAAVFQMSPVLNSYVEKLKKKKTKQKNKKTNNNNNNNNIVHTDLYSLLFFSYLLT